MITNLLDFHKNLSGSQLSFRDEIFHVLPDLVWFMCKARLLNEMASKLLKSNPVWNGQYIVA